MFWKQPIPTSLREEFGDDHLSRLIYQELLLMACNTSQVKNLNGQIITLERGQCYYTTLYFSKIFNRNRKSISTSIERLIRVYNRMDNRPTPRGSIATLLNYDEIVGMDNKTDNKTDNRWTTDGQQMDTNKNDKSVETEKNKNTNSRAGEKIENLKANPLYEKNKATSFPNLTDKEIDNFLETYFTDYPRAKLTSCFQFLADVSRKKVKGETKARGSPQSYKPHDPSNVQATDYDKNAIYL